MHANRIGFPTKTVNFLITFLFAFRILAKNPMKLVKSSTTTTMERWSCDGDGGAGGGFWVDTVAAAVDGVSHFREAKL